MFWEGSKMTIVVTIDLETGSKFQRDFAYSSLDTILKSWELYLKQSHKKNKVKIHIFQDK